MLYIILDTLYKKYITYIKGIKNSPSALLSFNNTREVLTEAKAVGECFSHFSNVLKNSQVLM